MDVYGDENIGIDSPREADMQTERKETPTTEVVNAPTTNSKLDPASAAPGEASPKPEKKEEIEMQDLEKTGTAAKSVDDGEKKS